MKGTCLITIQAWWFIGESSAWHSEGPGFKSRQERETLYSPIKGGCAQGELPGHTTNLAQLRQLSYAGPEGQLRISWAE